MDDTTKTPAATGGAQTIDLAKISDDFNTRLRGFVPAHVNGLASALRAGAKFPPVILWAEEGADGEPTGRLVLLDGRHRLAALRKAKPQVTKVRAVTVTGDLAAALSAAAEANTKTSLPLTPRERTNAAWRIVLARGKDMSRKRIALVCGIGQATVSRMRAKLAEWPEGEEPRGDWTRDQLAGGPGRRGEWKEESDEERGKRARELAEKLIKHISPKDLNDYEFMGDAFVETVGMRHAYGIMEYLFPADDPYDSGEAPQTGLRDDDDSPF